VVRSRRFIYSQPAGLIKVKLVDQHALHPARTPIFVREDALEGSGWIEGDALVFGSLDFPGMGRHFVAAFQASHGNLAAQPHRAAGDIDSNIAAAQHQYMLPKAEG